jgi:membrane glycosyltransferase
MTPERTTNGMREQPVGELLKQVSQDMSLLVRQELALALAEMTEKGKRAGAAAGMFAAAGIVGLLALGTLTTCVVAALATGMVWIAALIVTVLYGASAGVLALSGRKRVAGATPAVPEPVINADQ